MLHASTNRRRRRIDGVDESTASTNRRRRRIDGVDETTASIGCLAKPW